ncbi:MAG: nucleoside triphosphate pyrophosphohydrolase [Desulfobacteraceae bacterium]|nr:nucleoside triphosphate pyrophosphohydrolase [Desulfobacteraceae bacterium]
MDDLISIIKTLRSKDGCPWDREQTPDSIAVYVVEEVFELVNAIESQDIENICEELGDVLFQVLFIVQLFGESGGFSLEKVISGAIEKMVRRHPHVFGHSDVESPEQVKKQWHDIKKKEKTTSDGVVSAMDSIPHGLPALMRAFRISERVAALGFDWDEMPAVMKKLDEEWQEFEIELEKSKGSASASPEIAEEFGDLMFTLVNVARFAKIHPEMAATKAVLKFERRFRHMEDTARQQGTVFESLSRNEKERLWEAAKKKW